METLDEMMADKSFQKFLSKRENLKTPTVKTYGYALMLYCRANNKTFHEIVKEQRLEQRSRIENGVIIPYEPDYGTIDTYQENFIKFEREKGVKNTSIKLHLRNINTVLRGLNIKTPTFPKLSDDSKKWYLLSKEDIKYVLSISNVKYRGLIGFLASTGMRIGDCLDLTIQDYIDATYNFHKSSELRDFLSNATDEMVGFWDYYPKKTKEYKIRHKTFNSSESNKDIILMLRQRYNKIGDLMSKNDFLFSSQVKMNKGQIATASVSDVFTNKNKHLQAEKKRVLSEQLKSGKISKDTYDKLIRESAKFHPHALRKYYITMVAMNCSNPRAISLLEGHTSLLKTDSSYVDVDMIDDLVKQEYDKVLPFLQFSDASSDFELLKKYEELIKENSKNEILIRAQEINNQELKQLNKQIKEENEFLKDNIEDIAEQAAEKMFKENLPILLRKMGY